MSEGPAKILIRHVTGETVDIETPWANRVGPNLYEVDNMPWYAYGISLGDVVEAVAVEGGLPEVTRVVRKSGNRTVRVILAPPIPQGEDSTPLLRQLLQRGCAYEGMNRRYISITIPPEVDLKEVCEILTASGQQWEHADPTYNELYPEPPTEPDAAG